MNRVAIVTSHFAPSNLVGMHRTRLWSWHLREFGWEPVVVTVSPEHHEEKLDYDMLRLVPPGLEVVETRALAVTKPRLVGDTALRGMPWLYAALRRLAEQDRIDFVLLTLPSFYVPLLGPPVHRFLGLPYGIDYQDPWVHPWPGEERVLSRARLASTLARTLEPLAVRHARLIAGVTPGYIRGVLERNPHLHEQAAIATMPLGFTPHDYVVARELTGAPEIFNSDDAHLNLLYAGALLPKAYAVLERFFEGVVRLRERAPGVAARLRLHFFGTGTSPDDPEGYNVLPIAERYGLADLVNEHPNRRPYLDVLHHLAHADGVLIVGSTESHYSPSKVYQGILSERPVYALLHEASSAAAVIRETGAGEVLTLTEAELPSASEIAEALERFLKLTETYRPDQVDREALEPYSARSSARTLAGALDEALVLHRAATD